MASFGTGAPLRPRRQLFAREARPAHDSRGAQSPKELAQLVAQLKALPPCTRFRELSALPKATQKDLRQHLLGLKGGLGGLGSEPPSPKPVGLHFNAPERRPAPAAAATSPHRGPPEPLINPRRHLHSQLKLSQPKTLSWTLR
ncbi:unnamed protein product [Polarella glacialis]|uniref:Uncharacterized protein n=1 Tax=Polarella glacialis TaxID=89957 RepID=A0A813G0V7_POLGL|nr:unnamed protein product [Polarella glacialis]